MSSSRVVLGTLTQNFCLRTRLTHPPRHRLLLARCYSETTTTPAGAEGEPLTLTKEKSGIRTITLNNPKKRNALSLAMMDSLRDAIMANVDNPELRVIILKGAGPVLSAGHDLKELTSETGREYHEKVFQRCTEVMTLVQDIPVPVIAQVKGLATAAGCQLVASCDIAVAADTARFATPGVSVGLFCTTPGVALARAVPRKVAMEMLLTGHPITAQDALLHGLVSKVVPEDKLDQETCKLAERICETSRPVVALGKSYFYKQVVMDRDTAYRGAQKLMVDNLAYKDGQEGISAFIHKRSPVWTHE